MASAAEADALVLIADFLREKYPRAALAVENDAVSRIAMAQAARSHDGARVLVQGSGREGFEQRFPLGLPDHSRTFLPCLRRPWIRMLGRSAAVPARRWQRFAERGIRGQVGGFC